MRFRVTARHWSKVFLLSRRKSVVCRNISSTIYPIQPGHVDGNHDELYAESINKPDQFWGDLAKRRLRWMKEFDTVMDCDMNKGKINWFLGGKLNVSGNLIKWALPILQYNIVDNCIDRHVEASPDRVALVWEKDEPNQHERVTYRYVAPGHDYYGPCAT